MNEVRSERRGEPAGVVTRTIAGAIDYALIVSAVAILYGSAQALLFVWDPSHFRPITVPFTVVVLAGTLLMFVYLTGAWSTSGRTVGGVLMGTRVLTSRGNRLHLLYAAMRAAFTLGFPVGLFWCALPERRSVQDLVLRTRVVYDYSRRGSHWTQR